MILWHANHRKHMPLTCKYLSLCKDSKEVLYEVTSDPWISLKSQSFSTGEMEDTGERNSLLEKIITPYSFITQRSNSKHSIRILHSCDTDR